MPPKPTPFRLSCRLVCGLTVKVQVADIGFFSVFEEKLKDVLHYSKLDLPPVMKRPMIPTRTVGVRKPMFPRRR